MPPCDTSHTRCTGAIGGDADSAVRHSVYPLYRFIVIATIDFDKCDLDRDFVLGRDG